LMNETVFAATQRPLDDQTAKMIGDVYSRHGDSGKQCRFGLCVRARVGLEKNHQVTRL
jgi:hypothetical protein